jgi:alpha-mannosidase
VASAEVVEDGARCGIRVVRPFMKSTITQTMWFYDHVAKVDFETTIDMHQHQQMIKAAFDVDVQSDKATYDVQFGSVERPTHKNTSWDRAKFEVCAHRYADLSDGGYGVSLMNDCKYGYDIHDGTMMLSLLKTGTMPYPDADQGEHSFVYSLYVHNGTVRDGDTAEQAALLNNPLTAVKACGADSSLPERFALVTMDRPNVFCETIKEAEDSGDIIVRLYENKNIRTKTQLTLGFQAEKCWLCDLLENEQQELPVENGKVNVKLGGFEIVTLKFRV